MLAPRRSDQQIVGRIAVRDPVLADRAGDTLLQTLAGQFPAPSAATIDALLRPVGEHWIPDSYAAHDLLV